MARIDDASATAARRILNLEEVRLAETGPEDARVHALLEAFYALAQLAPVTAMPDRVVARLDEVLAGSEPDELVPAEPDDAKASGAIARAFALRARVPATALIMLIVALVLSVGANVLLARARQFRPETAIHLSGTGSAPDAQGVVMYDGDEIVVYADGLAELANGYRYVAWHSSGIGSDHLGSLTMLTATTGRLVAAVDQLLPVVVVTIEPSASPSSPTGPQILVGSSLQ